MSVDPAASAPAEMADDLSLPTSATTSSLAMATFDERVAAYSSNVLPADYTFDPALSVDDNYIVLILIYARLSTSKRGNMACILVDPTSSPPATNGATTARDDAEPPAKRARPSSPSPPPFPSYPGRILAHSNNTPEPHSIPSASSAPAPAKGQPGKPPRAPKAGQSAFLARASGFPELHAEARSLCLAARGGIRTEGATAYVSFPPCQACLPLLVAAGVRRCVYRQKMGAQAAVELCAREGVECVEVVEKEHDERLKDAVARFWRERGEGKEETRARLDRWWREQERRIMGATAAEVADGSAAAPDGAEEAGHAPVREEAVE
ncbi:hypothetical protein JCM10450v2_005274 [Rhodotorula kratochvilovae]